MPRRRRIHGGNFFHDIYNKVLKPVHNFVKSNKLVSRVAGVASLIPGPHQVAARGVATTAGLAGYGRRRKRLHGRGRKVPI